MDSRERTLLALDHQEPDRVPVDCWMTTGTKRKIRTRSGMTFAAFLDHHDIDLRYIDGPRYIGPQVEGNVDLWGVQRNPVELVLDDGAETYQEIVDSPLSGCNTVEKILDYNHWPSPDWFDYSEIASQCRNIREEKRIVVFMGDRLNRLAQLKPAMYLRGTEQILVDLVEQPEIAATLFRKISAFYLEYGRRVLEAAEGMIDILCTGDDFGAQSGPLISPAMWEKHLQEGFQAHISLGHNYDARVMHHTCGSVVELLPRMIDCKLDILQSIQPEAAGMDAFDLKKSFGAQISFQGGVSIQSILPHGHPDEIRDHVRSLFAAMTPGGGFIAGTSHNIQVDTSVANIEALYSAFAEFGRY